MQIIFLFLLIFLSGCAVKHEPKTFPPSFNLYPNHAYQKGMLIEIEDLEERYTASDLNLFEKKRLYDLHKIELSVLKEKAQRSIAIKTIDEKLLESISTFQDELNNMIASNVVEAPQELNSPFSDAAHKREFSKIIKLWNQDQNEEALLLLSKWVKDEKFESLSKVEKFKLYNLLMRIAQDIGKQEFVFDIFQSMKQMDNCAPETAQASLMIALDLFQSGKIKEAKEIYETQCDTDVGISNKLKKTYWLYRFSEGDEKEKKYNELQSFPFPGYYAYLAKSERNEVLQVYNEEASLEQPTFEVGSEAKKNLIAAEDCLKHGLKKAAALYLKNLIKILKKDIRNNKEALFYVASLFRAAGEHLEAMKTILLFNELPFDSKEVAKWHWQAYIPVVFPKPHEEKVSFLSSQWDVDPDFVYSIMRQESAFSPEARSSADARGLLQMMPFLAKSIAKQWRYPFADKWLFWGVENLKFSTFHLYQLKRTTPHFALMAAGYNAGFKRVSNWMKRNGEVPMDVFVEKIPITETRNYVKLVLRNFIYYKALSNKGVVAPGFFSTKL